MKKSLQHYDEDIRFYVKEKSFFARMAAMWLHAPRMAIVIGKTVYLHNATAEAFVQNERWLRHEVTHIRQFRQYGFLRFIFLYLSESIQHGYYKNKFEAEARASENEDTFK